MYEGLGGGYRTEIGPGGYPLDGVQFVSKARSVQPPVGRVPGPDAPIPASTAKPNRQSNVTIPYTRTATRPIERAEIVFVHRSSNAARSHVVVSNVARAGAPTASPVASVAQLNEMLALPENHADDENEIKNGAMQSWTLDGVVLALENGDDDDAGNLVGDNFPAIAVAVQGPALLQNGDGKRVQERSEGCGGVLYVALVADDVPGSAKIMGKLVCFSSFDVTRHENSAPGDSANPLGKTLLRVWKLGRVLDSVAAPELRRKGKGSSMVKVCVSVEELVERHPRVSKTDDAAPFARTVEEEDYDAELISLNEQLKELWHIN